MRISKSKTLIGSIAVLAMILLYVSCQSDHNSPERIPDQVSYNYDIRPILSDKCFNCHGPDAKKREAGLRLDIGAEAFKALQEHPNKHAIVPGKPEQSELYLRITSKDTGLQMPSIKSRLPRLTQHEIDLIKKWIEQGAKYEPHWAFVAPVKPELPKIDDKSWVINELDYFVLAKMQSKGLSPNAQASKERLLKRLYIDLVGLLPSPKETELFLQNTDPKAYEKTVDQLLARPQYGEKMAIGWLDIARYADSHGYQDDNYRSQWPWRDWVIHTFNKNLSYDSFITWQLAGDLLPKATKEQLLATGFNRNHKITEEGGVIDEEYRIQYVDDRTATLGRSLLAMTVECAKCHDHKYDPISQKDYYQLSAFFNSVKEKGLESTVGGPDTWAKNPRMRITQEDLKSTLSFIHALDTNKLEVSIMGDLDTMRKTYILTRGAYDAKAEEVAASTPAAILPFNHQLPANRLGLTKWLFDPKNPLTARVYVNRIWQEFFGRGLVKTVADFGMQGELPTNPALLDWMAVDFREHGWNIKRLVKQIVMSATYQQASNISKEKLEKDPLNIYLSYAPRLRYPAEVIRDMLLGSSGLLNTSIGGPSVKPYQPPGLWEMATSGRGILKKYVQDTGAALYRRGIYTFIKRTVPPPSMILFDGSNRDECQVSRYRTNTPLQALIMLNDPTVIEASKALSDQLLMQQKKPKELIEIAFQTILCRKPSEQEMTALQSYWDQAKKQWDGKSKEWDKTLSIGAYQPKTKNKLDLVVSMQTIQLMYNMQEAITKT